MRTMSKSGCAPLAMSGANSCVATPSGMTGAAAQPATRRMSLIRFCTREKVWSSTPPTLSSLMS